MWIVPFAICLTAGSARADDEAVTRFERGVQLYEAQNYDGAVVEFNAAYKLSKNFKLLYNIGICQMAQKEYAAATASFKQYLADGGAEISEARKADVKDRLAKLALMVTHVRITTDAPAGATLTIDDQPAGTAPFAEPVTVKVGRRVFTITAQGKTTTKSVDISSGEGNAPVSLMLGDASSSAPPPPAGDSGAPKPPPADEGPSFPIIPWGITALLGGATAVTGILAVGARNDLGEKQATFGIEKSALEEDRDRAQRLGIITDVLLVGTVIGAGVSTWLTIRWASAPKRVGAGPAPKKSSGLTILPLGLGYAGSF